MTLLSAFGYRPNKKKPIKVASHISPQRVSVVIPVKNNQAGITRFLSRLQQVMVADQRPLEVIIVDNNSDQPLSLPKDYPLPLTLAQCKLVGPAAARNVGVGLAKGEWVLFTDSDCIPTANMVAGYSTKQNHYVAYAGGIEIISNDLLSRYYRGQETLTPREAIYSERLAPDYLVTANCLVLKAAIEHIGGFDCSFKQAGGEDIDLAFRLLEIGELAYQFNSITVHEFDDGFSGFVKRFQRYGRGVRQLADKYQLDFKPRPFLPTKFTWANLVLALIEYVAYATGYAKGGLK
ncbi:glycosyltransferase [Agarivorans sp. 1_MG-2023]|uniref:glycosyltransferase n=1 Tax=Agarivorans sp. 1_MG-2023 TaxID=3062634 RepID=UPI0026E2992B|nr:glycosyltransferase [Agarivorans sp. 1_MG-2023]MDO6762043.1 glycosyltransferase [Agarivorans sp. 1_MG-2023]